MYEETWTVDSLGPLMTLVQAGNADALTRVYDQTCRQVYRAARRIVRRDDEAEEVMLDVFAQVWRIALSYEPARGSVEGWLLMLTRSRALDRLRTRQARPDLDTDRSVEFEGDRLTDHFAGADVVASLDVRRRATAMLGVLTADERRLIELAFYDGYSHAELADLLDRPLGTVKTRIRGALNKMRRAQSVAAGDDARPVAS